MAKRALGSATLGSKYTAAPRAGSIRPRREEETPMTTQTGMLSREALRAGVEQGTIDTVLVVFTDHYGRFISKRYDSRFFLEDGLEHGTHACDYLLTVDMEMGAVPGYRFASWEQGYGDFHVSPDLSTLRTASWLDRTAIVLCDVRNVKTGELVEVAPRSILRRQVEKAAAAGFVAKAASELEYYLYRDSYRAAAANGWREL